jgi:hypothetical protein
MRKLCSDDVGDRVNRGGFVVELKLMQGKLWSLKDPESRERKRLLEWVNVCGT